jgi:hypothetical protein
MDDKDRGRGQSVEQCDSIINLGGEVFHLLIFVLQNPPQTILSLLERQWKKMSLQSFRPLLVTYQVYFGNCFGIMNNYDTRYVQNYNQLFTS